MNEQQNAPNQLNIEISEEVAEGTYANLAIITKGLSELAARKVRLESERDGDESLQFPADLLARKDDPDVAGILEGERRLFELRRNARIGQ